MYVGKWEKKNGRILPLLPLTKLPRFVEAIATTRWRATTAALYFSSTYSKWWDLGGKSWIHLETGGIQSHFALEPWPTTPHQVTTLRRSHCYDVLEGTTGSCQNRIEDQQRGREGGFALAIQFGEFCLAFPVSNTNCLFSWIETKTPLLLHRIEKLHLFLEI